MLALLPLAPLPLALLPLALPSLAPLMIVMLLPAHAVAYEPVNMTEHDQD